MPIWCSTKICHEAAFNDIHKNFYKEYSRSTIKAPGKSEKAYLELNKTSKRYGRHSCNIFVVKLVQVPHSIQCFLYIP